MGSAHQVRTARGQVADILERLCLFEPISRLRQLAGMTNLVVFTYHRVTDTKPRFEDGVVEASSELFDQQVVYLAKNFDLITTKDLLAAHDGNVRLPSRPAMISFDDGYLDCHRVVLPILRNRGASAVFFIATSFIEDRRISWWDALAYLVKQSSARSVEIVYPHRLSVSLSDKDFTLRLFQSIVKNHSGLEVDRFVQHVASVLDVQWTDEVAKHHADDLIMTWHDIRELVAAGMDVQSHTHTHRVLETLNEKDLDTELEGARLILESRLGTDVRAIAYPVGRSIKNHSHVVDALARSGYRLGFSNASGYQLASKPLDPFNIRRIALDSSLNFTDFKAILAVPRLAHVSFYNR